MVDETDPDWSDPRFQQRVVKVERLIPIIENAHGITLECGHREEAWGGPTLRVGMMVFCAGCCDEAKLKELI